MTLNGRTIYCGDWGTAAAAARYAELIADWEANGRQLPEIADTVSSLQRSSQRRAAELGISLEQSELVGDVLRESPALSAAEALVLLRIREPGLFDSRVNEVVPTLRKAVAEFEAHLDRSGRYRKNGQKTTQRDIIAKALAEFVEACGEKPVTEYSKADLLRHRDALEERSELSRTGINRKVGIIRQAFGWLFERDMLTPEQWYATAALKPIRRSSLPGREHKRPKRAPAWLEVREVIRQAGQTVGAMVEVQWLTGMRPADVVGMRWGDVDRDGVDIDGVRCWVYTVANAKAEHHGKSTVYALPPRAQAILEQFGPATPTGFVFSPRRAMLDRHDVLRARRRNKVTDYTRKRDRRTTRAFGERYTVGDYRQAVERAIHRCKDVARFTPHSLRHAFVSRAVQAYGLAAASLAANHASVAVTAGYTHADRSDAFRVVVGLERDSELDPEPELSAG